MIDPKQIVPPARRAARQLRTAAEQSRTDMIRAVRAACRRLGIDDDTRKAIQVQHTGKASMADMTPADLSRLLDHFNRDRKAPMGHRAHVGKIKALWWTLYWLGEIDTPDEQAISAFVERQTGVSALRFLDHRKAASVIEALKLWCRRAGVKWPDPETVSLIKAICPGFTEAQAERHAVLKVLGQRLTARKELLNGYIPYLTTALGLTNDHWCWSSTELDHGIRLLGKKWRRSSGGSDGEA